MNPENLLYLPMRVKIVAMVILISALLFSAAVTSYYLFWSDAESIYVLAALSVFQLTSTGAAVAIVAFSSKSSFGRETLLDQTSRWLTKDFVETLRAIDLPFERDILHWSANKQINQYSRVDVRVDHIEGTGSAFYEVRAFGTRLLMRVTLNSYRFVILFYVDEIDGKDTEDLRNSLDLVTSGAQHAGFEVRLAKNPALWASHINLNEIIFLKEASKDFLYNGTDRLFWSQDIATMTRSTIIQLKRHGWLMES